MNYLAIYGLLGSSIRFISFDTECYLYFSVLLATKHNVLDFRELTEVVKYVLEYKHLALCITKEK